MRLSKGNPESDTSTPSLSDLSPKVQRLLSSLISKRDTISDQISELEESKKIYSDEIVRLFQENDITSLILPDGRKPKITTRITRHLSESKLLDHGVTIKVIQACTEEKESEPYLEIRPVKSKERS